VLESLIKVGAFDSINKNRGGLLEGVERILALAQKEQRLRQAGQATMFDMFGDTSQTPLPAIDFPPVEIGLKDKLIWEKELLGIYVSEHPMRRAAKELAPHITVLCGQVSAELAGQSVVVAGMVSQLQTRVTRENRPFVTAVLEDLEGGVEVTAWPEVYRSTAELWEEGRVLLVWGKVKVRDDRVGIICDRVRAFEPSAEAGEETASGSGRPGIAGEAAKKIEEPPPRLAQPTGNIQRRKVLIKITQGANEEEDIALFNKVISILKSHPGKDEAILTIVSDEDVVNLEMPDLVVSYDEGLKRDLRGLADRIAVEAYTES
jgi:DNA polymerase III alpha subunit